jgi:hypothetical protein
MVKEDDYITNTNTNIKKVLHCPFCQERSAGLIYPDDAIAEAHSEGRWNCSKSIQVGLWIQIPVLLVLFFIHHFEPNRSNIVVAGPMIIIMCR